MDIEQKTDQILQKLTNMETMLRQQADERRWQTIPKAAITLKFNAKKLRQLCEKGYIGTLMHSGHRKVYKIDVIATAEWFSKGGLTEEIRKELK